jgi:AraC-like DNA-binding protein
MQVENLFQPFEIRFVQGHDCPVKQHKHTFFELAYIISGEGHHYINGNKFGYRSDNLFLMKPGDSHHFVIVEETSFMLVRFNQIYLDAQKADTKHGNLGDWAQKLEYILQSTQTLGCLIRNRDDKPLTRALTTAIQQEYEKEHPLQRELVQQLINTLMTVVARNISLHHSAPSNVNSNTLSQILQYLHQNIYQPDKLKAETIAAVFHISQNYISEYFKKHTGETLQQYIINYKLKLAETRLQYSDMRLNEIAFELGFSDESHLTKTFKKYKGVSPSQFRKQLSVA